MSGDFSKWGAPEGTPSNDPGERGDKALPQADGWGFDDPGLNDSATGSVNREGFDPHYTKDGTDIWDSPRTVGNVPSDGSKLTQSAGRRKPRSSKGYPTVLD